MNLKKLIPELVEGFNELGFESKAKAIQSQCLPIIKSGSDLFMIAPEGEGKTTAVLIGLIQQLKAEFEEAPRAILVAPDKETAFELKKQFEALSRYTSLRVFTAIERGDMKYQKDLIFDGIDLLITTPIRVTELLKKNGIPLSNLKMIFIDDAHLIKTDKYIHIYGLADKAPKAQVVISADKWNLNFERFSNEVMKGPRVVNIEKS